MLFPDIRAASGSKFFIFSRTVPHDTAPKTVDTVALLDQETPDCIPPALWPPNSPDLNPGDCTVWSILQERVYRTYQDLGCRRSETTHQHSTASGSLWVTQLLNVLLASGVSVYALASMLEADFLILSTRCNKDDVMSHVWLFWETITASRVCRYSVNVHLIIAMTVFGSIWRFKFPKVV